jgi:DNA-cytosine methyltransferase
MNVLSLFDGMSCGQIALEKLGIPVKNYFAAEIDKYAIQVAKSNYPDMVHLGDVKNIKTSGTHLMDEFDCGHKIDLLIGGSPCQGFSFAGKQLNFDDPRSQLFFEYVRLLKALKPKYFLLENVKMKKESMDIITEYLGVEPVEINSNLVSAQNRKRLYWTNIPMNGLPKDKGIMLKDILEPVEQIDDVYYYSDKSIAYMERGNEKWQQAGSRRADRYTQTPDTKKAFTITANFHKGVPYNYFDDVRDKSKCVRSGGRGSYDRHEWDSVDTNHIRKLTVTECERLQTVPDGYTCGVSNTQRYKMLGNGWTVDVIKHIFEGLKETA